MDNAVKNTVKGYIEIKNEMAEEYPILVIEDSGVGMSAEQIQHYNSFLHSDHSAAVTSYVGFGFLFMKDAQTLLDLKIELEPAPYGGLRVLLHLYNCTS
jgi:K+-sensing histidine kinase KdpD